MTSNREKLEAIAQALLEFETIDGTHMQEIMEHGRIINPPHRPTPPDIPDEEEPPAEKESRRPDEEGGEFPGGLAPVGA